MQSKNLHLERLTVTALERAITILRDIARRRAGIDRRQAEELQAVNEFLLRPMCQTVRELAEVGGSAAEPSPVQAEAYSQPVAGEPLSIVCPNCHAPRGMSCRNTKFQKKVTCRLRKQFVEPERLEALAADDTPDTEAA